MAKSKPYYFFKVFFSDDPSNQLKIPQAFGEHIKVGSSSKVSLKGPCGNIWKVHLVKKSDEFFFEDGWDEFVADHSFVSGDLLLFRYDGNSRFRVVVFDSTACERKALLGKPSLEDEEVRVVEENDEVQDGMLIGKEDENKPLALFIKRIERKLKRKGATTKRDFRYHLILNGNFIRQTITPTTRYGLKCGAIKKQTVQKMGNN